MHSNIRLQELDKELEKRKLPYVRYADDFSVYTKSNPAARKVGNQVYLFLQEKLKLPINRKKSGIRKPVQEPSFHFHRNKLNIVFTQLPADNLLVQMLHLYQSR